MGEKDVFRTTVRVQSRKISPYFGRMGESLHLSGNLHGARPLNPKPKPEDVGAIWSQAVGRGFKHVSLITCFTHNLLCAHRVWCAHTRISPIRREPCKVCTRAAIKRGVMGRE